MSLSGLLFNIEVLLVNTSPAEAGLIISICSVAFRCPVFA